MPPVPRLVIGLIGADGTLTAACRATLSDLAEVRPQSVHLTPSIAQGLAAAIVVLPDASKAAVSRFRELQSAYPALKMILIGRGLDVNIVVELLKSGAEDYLELPYDASALRRKIERALYLESRPAEGTLLEAFAGKEINRRAAFRVRIPSDTPSYARLPLAHTVVSIPILDISLATDENLGGMSWLATPLTANDLPLSTWVRGTVVPFHIDLYGTKVKIPAKAIIVRVTLPPPGPIKETLDIGVQYTIDNPYDERVAAKFWAECQRAQMRENSTL